MLEILLAFWMTAVFAERLVVDLATVKYQSENRLHRALSDPALYLYLCFGFSLLLLSLVLNRATVDYLLDELRKTITHLLQTVRDLRSMLVLLIASFLALLFKSLRSSNTIAEVVLLWLKKLYDVIADNIILLLVMLGSLLFYKIMRLLARQFAADPKVKDIVNSWAASNIFVILNALLYVVIYLIVFDRFVVEPAMKTWFWTGFAKDAAIYTIAGLYIANALLRYSQALTYLTPAGIWHSYGVFAVVTTFVGVLSIAMDMNYVDKINVAGSKFALEYPDLSARQIMYAHVYSRDFGFFVVPLFLWFGFLLLRAAKTAQR